MEIGKNNRIEQTPIHDLNLPANPHGYWLFGSSDFQSENMISSQARYDHFDTLPNIQPYYFTEFPVKSQEQNAAERGEKEKRIFDMVGMNFVIAGSGGNLLY